MCLGSSAYRLCWHAPAAAATPLSLLLRWLVLLLLLPLLQVGRLLRVTL
jgi:hypothetical protein